MSPLVIRADAGNQMGTGHVMRMLALAQAWHRRGGETIFVTAECPPGLIDRITAEGFAHHAITDEDDATSTIVIAEEWLVLDGYHFDTYYQGRCKDAGLKLLCVDDYGHCEAWNCDLLLNQNLGATQKGTIEATSLLGISYALLRQEFLDHPRMSKSWTQLHKILITLGGSDPPNATSHVLKLLTTLDRSDLEIRVIIGPSNPHRDSLKALELPFDVQWRESVTEMPAEYAWADGVISAGGSSCWEWLYFGLPGAVITIAENQEPVVRALKKENIALCPGWPSEWTDAASLLSWIEDPGELLDQERANSLIDGRGADRILANLDESNCILRSTDPLLDQEFTFELVNEPSVRSVGYATEEIPWDHHCAWLERHHLSPDSHLFIIESSTGNPVGLLRFHRIDAFWEIGIALDPSARKQGFADHGVRLGMTELARLRGIHHFTATIRPSNAASKNLFERLGFHHNSTDNDREIWTIEIP